jgi:hypothetical protein
MWISCGAGSTVNLAVIFKSDAAPNFLTNLRLQQNIGSEVEQEYRQGGWPNTAKCGAVLNASGWPATGRTVRFQNIWRADEFAPERRWYSFLRAYRGNRYFGQLQA